MYVYGCVWVYSGMMPASVIYTGLSAEKIGFLKWEALKF